MIYIFIAFFYSFKVTKILQMNYCKIEKNVFVVLGTQQCCNIFSGGSRESSASLDKAQIELEVFEEQQTRIDIRRRGGDHQRV